ncbi:MAG: SoxR reducing system RseC family protein [Xanthomonadales bacterium]|nr:SoxR reducing system RseC family protein [Xanthomonadales bacterium]
MIEQNVQVLRSENERIWVRMGAQSGCTACDNGKGCGAGLFARLVQRKPVILELARNEMKVKTGQMLTLSFPEQVYMKLVFASYGWPLIGALAGAFGGYSLGVWLQFRPMLIDAVTLIGGVLAAWLVMRFFRTGKTTEAIFDSLELTVCNPSNTPNMCTGIVNEPEHH